MPMTPAEKQRAYRERQRERIRQLQQAAAGNVTGQAEQAAGGNVTSAPGPTAADGEALTRQIEAVVATWPKQQQRRFHYELMPVVLAWAQGYARSLHPDALRKMEEARAEHLGEVKKYAAMRKGIKPQLTETEYRQLLGALHPDREVSAEKKAAAFDIVRRLGAYVEAFKA